MALNIQGYLEPGTYQSEVVVPTGVSLNSTPLALVVIGTGSRTKKSINEAVLRGQVNDEPLTPTGTPAVDTLANRALRRASYVNITKNGTTIANTDWQFNPAYLDANTAGPYDCSTNKLFTFSLDGRTPVVMEFASPTTGAGGLSVAVAAKAGSTVQFVATISDVTVALATLTAAQVAAAINAVLVYATDVRLGTGKGYGAAYASAATAPGGKLKITSPLNDVNSDVAVYHGFQVTDAGQNALTVSTSGIVVSTELNAVHAKTEITINNYSANATYLIDYIAYDATVDALLQANVQGISRVGNYASISSYKLGTDFSQVNDTISWAATSWASAVLLGVAGPYDVSTNKNLTISIDGRNSVTIDLSGGGTLPPGGAAPSSAAAATAAELAALINASLAASLYYGPLYKGVATDTGGTLKLTSPSAGQAGIVEVGPSATADASATVFGLQNSQLPYDIRGTGQRPPAGLIYFVTYTYTRPDAEYNVPKRFYSPDDFYADIGNPAPDNKLSVAGQIAFKNGAPSVFAIQVNDVSMPGSASQLQLEAGLASAGIADITEVVVLDSRPAIFSDLMTHITEQCGPTVQHPRRAWMGLSSNAVGDVDTASSYVYVATHVLQVPGDSPARGRLFLVAPGSGMTVPVTLDDGSEQDVSVDGPFVAVAVAARYTARTSVAQAMVGSPITGFNTDTFPAFKPPERRLMASNGVLVIQNDAGNLIMIDPLSTESGGLPQFEEPSASSQKDNITLAVNKAINGNLRGVVPTDLSDFIISIKMIIGSVLEGSIVQGAIGPFRDDQGRTRALNYGTDIQVFQLKNDPRRFTFKYWYMLRYPAKVFEGSYSVDSPFFSS